MARMRALATVSSFCVVALLLLGCGSDATKARAALALGKSLATAGTLARAGASFANATRLDPRLHEAFARLARVRLTQGRARDAETAALRAASLAPRSSFYSELFARAQLAAGKQDGALASFEQAMTLDAAQTARLAFTIGAMREQMGKPEDALAAYERAATADPAAVLPRLALARLQLRADRLDLAEKRLAEVRAHVPAEGSERVLFAALEARVATLTREHQSARERETQRAMGQMMRASNSAILRRLLGGTGSMGRVFSSGGLADVFGSGDSGASDWLVDVDAIGIGGGGLGTRGAGMGGGGTAGGLGGLGTRGTARTSAPAAASVRPVLAAPAAPAASAPPAPPP